MRTERGPRSRAATQLGPLATNGRELSSNKGVKLQSVPTNLLSYLAGGHLATNGRELSSNKGVKLQSAPTILPRRGPPSYQREGAKLQQGS